MSEENSCLVSPGFGFSPGIWLDQDSNIVSPKVSFSPYLLNPNIVSPTRVNAPQIHFDSVDNDEDKSSNKCSNPIRPFENLRDLDEKIVQLNSLVKK